MEFVQKNKKDVYQTPEDFIDDINEALPEGIFIATDPSAAEDTDIGWFYNYTVEDNGLEQPWYGISYCNPPFTLKDKFLEKAIEESKKEYSDLIMVLTPDSTDVKSWWHEYIADEADYIWFKFGRMNFYDPVKEQDTNNVSFGIALSFFGDLSKYPELKEYFMENGQLVKTVKN